MHANMRRDVVALYCGGAAVTPLASQVQVVGALAADMALADMVLQRVSLGHVKMFARHGWIVARWLQKANPCAHASTHIGSTRRHCRVVREHTYIELFGGWAALAAILPLADERVGRD